MIISVEGTGPRNSDKLEEAARFFAAQLLHPRTVANLEIDIEVERTHEMSGTCNSEDDHKSPRYFTVMLRKQRVDEMIRVLAHEMVHVKQYAKNELSTKTRTTPGRGAATISSMWCGEWWVPKSKEDGYWDAPWELEAYGKENGLMHKWYTRNDPNAKWYVGKNT
jgi:hypothetical protein